MATTFFATNTNSTRNSSTWVASSGYSRKVLDTSRGAGVQSNIESTIASLSVAPISVGSTFAAMGGSSTVVQTGTTPEGMAISGWAWFTEPISPVTISGTITVNCRAFESNAMANYACVALVYRIPAGNGAAVKVGFGSNSTEIGVAEAAFSVSITPTSTAFSNGDFIALRFGYASAAGTTSASGFTATTFWAGTSSGASGDTFVTFTETITPASTATFYGEGNELHGDPNSLQVLDRNAIMRSAVRCCADKWDKVSGLWIPSPHRLQVA
jgi:hypothetical protein